MAYWATWICREELSKMFVNSSKGRKEVIQEDQLGGQRWWESRNQAATEAAEDTDKVTSTLNSTGGQADQQWMKKPDMDEKYGIWLIKSGSTTEKQLENKLCCN